MVKNRNFSSHQGFTLIEMMIVVAVIGVIAAISYPNYQRYVIKTKRTAMMTDLQNIGSQIQAQKLAKGAYNSADTASLTTAPYPLQGNVKLYNVTINLDTDNDGVLGDWTITATPIMNSQMATDGSLTLNSDGIKCRNITSSNKVCGKANEWNP